MENELIIDGQVIGLSETQENAEETIIQTESQPENESQDDNGKEVATEPEKTEETPEDYALRIGDEEIQLNADDDDHIDGKPAPQSEVAALATGLQQARQRILALETALRLHGLID
ncbi:hypothetical protein H6280_001156 [Escherichia coli]|nr:hypothetical protein [Escherichia coli]